MIKPYILLADKTTAVYNPHRMYEQSEVYGVVFSDVTGKHIRVLSPRELTDQKLLPSYVNMPETNVYPFEVDALFDFNGKKDTAEFEKAGSKAVENIKEICGDEWFIPALGELVAAIHCRKEIDDLLSHIKDSYQLFASTNRWTTSRYSQYHAYFYNSRYGLLNFTFFYYSYSVAPITLLPEGAQRPKVDNIEILNTAVKEFRMSDSNELLAEISNGETHIKIYR